MNADGVGGVGFLHRKTTEPGWSKDGFKVQKAPVEQYRQMHKVPATNTFLSIHFPVVANVFSFCAACVYVCL